MAVFDDENHERREDVSQRTWCNEDTDSLSRPSSQTDRTISVHIIQRERLDTPRTITRGGARWAGELLPDCAALHISSYDRQVANLGPCDALRAVACHALGSVAQEE